jgi:hypothetical protein
MQGSGHTSEWTGQTVERLMRNGKRIFQRGDTVTFEDRDGRGITGVIVRINQRTATIGTGPAYGGTWRVPFHILRHVLDI